MQTRQHFVPNGAGWRLSLFQTFDPEKRVPGRRPVLIVPGYGMNSFIFSYHPSGLSLEGYLVQAGFEVWRVDLRGQGESQHAGGSKRYGLEELALTDLPVALSAVLERTGTGADRVDLLGASLGATLMFGYAVVHKGARLGTLCSLGGPLRWVDVHPAVRLAFRSPRLAGALDIRGTRALARLALPVLARATPWALGMYLNPANVDLSNAHEMVRTVEDPSPALNREIAEWMLARDLTLRGHNLSEGLRELELPLLVVAANADGIVPPRTAAWPFYQSGARERHLLEVGDASTRVSHADLFLWRRAAEEVFDPVARWFARFGP